jgi:uncharacterized protein (DUF1015 family)
MASVKPFQALHYQPDKVAIEQVVAPPYDVISEQGKQALLKQDPKNAIRLILGQVRPDEKIDERRYKDAKKCLDEWLQEGTLAQDAKEAFYLLEMSYKHPYQDKTLTRLALFGLLKLEPFDRQVVFPHERTHSSPKVDRGKLLRATKANFSPIFTIYEDTTTVLDDIRNKCEDRTPLFDFVDDASVLHRVWVIAEPSEVKQIASGFGQRKIFIADGHHRYETALNYAEEMRKKAGKKKEGNWEYTLSTLVRFSDPGLLILPIHRVISSRVKIKHDEFLEGLKKHFILHSVASSVLARISEGAITEGLGLALSEKECYLLELKDRTTARQSMPEGKVKSWYDLDMNLLSHLILEPLLHVGGKNLERSVTYTPSYDEAMGKVREGKAACAFFIRPLDALAIKDVCESGDVMPQKSTYFYPKFPSGLVMSLH